MPRHQYFFEYWSAELAKREGKAGESRSRRLARFARNCTRWKGLIRDSARRLGWEGGTNTSVTLKGCWTVLVGIRRFEGPSPGSGQMAAGWLIAWLIGWSMTQVHQWLFSSWQRMPRSHVSYLVTLTRVYARVYASLTVFRCAIREVRCPWQAWNEPALIFFGYAVSCYCLPFVPFILAPSSLILKILVRTPSFESFQILHCATSCSLEDINSIMEFNFIVANCNICEV